MWSVVKVGLVILLCAHLINGENVSNSYARIGSSGSSRPDSDGPKIFKALHMDLNIPTTTRNETANVKPVTQNIMSTGRAYNNPNYYRRPIIVNANRPPSLVYPQHRPSYKRIDVAMDRFTPGEAVATNKFKMEKTGYNYNPPKIKAPPPSIPDYLPPKDLYSFPPNIDANYLPPTKILSEKPKKPINSYVPPPAGSPNFPESPNYPGPVSPDYLPSFFKDAPPMHDMNDKGKNADKTEDNEAMPSNDQDDMLPPLNSNGDSSEMAPEKDMSSSGMDKPPSGMDKPPSAMDNPPSSDDFMPDIDSIVGSLDDSPPPMDHHHDHHAAIDDDVPDDHFHHHHSPSFYGSHGIDAYPELIYDDHDHHFHHDHPPEMVMTTTTSAPEPPPEPRVKKYSYFYLGRKLWYIPLYFTVWFSFYIFWLIVKSIARHKVNLPNHYTGRMMKRSATPAYFENGPTMESLNNLTSMVVNYIESFEKKYSNAGKT